MIVINKKVKMSNHMRDKFNNLDAKKASRLAVGLAFIPLACTVAFIGVYGTLIA